MKSIRLSIIFFVLTILLSSHDAYSKAKTSIRMAQDLSSIASSQTDKPKIVLPYIAALECPHCKRLEKDIILPMLSNAKYRNLVEIYKVNLDSTRKLVNFKAESLSSNRFAAQLQAKVTPSLLFMSPTGEELTTRLIGYQGDEFYWYQLDEKIKLAYKGLNAK